MKRVRKGALVSEDGVLLSSDEYEEYMRLYETVRVVVSAKEEYDVRNRK